MSTQLRADNSDHSKPLLIDLDILPQRIRRSKQAPLGRRPEHANRRSAVVTGLIEESSAQYMQSGNLLIDRRYAHDRRHILLRLGNHLRRSHLLARSRRNDALQIVLNDPVILQG